MERRFYRVVFNYILLLAFMTFCIVVMVSCTIFPKTKNSPKWLSQGTLVINDIYYVTCGPALSLEKAKEQAYEELSGIVETRVRESLASYENVSSDALHQYVNKQFLSRINTSTESSLSGVLISDIYHDKADDSWWVRASISENDLEYSKMKTTEGLEKREEQFLKWDPYFQTVVSSLMQWNGTASEGLQYAFGALGHLLSVPYGDEMQITHAEIGTILVQQYLENNINKTLSSIVPVCNNVVVFQPFNPTILEFSVKLPRKSEGGTLTWRISDADTKQTILQFATYDEEKANVELPSSGSVKEQHLIISLDLEALGPDVINLSSNFTIPSVALICRREQPAVHIVFSGDQAVVTLATEALMPVFSRYLQVALTDVVTDPQIRLIVHMDEDTTNSYGFFFCSLSVDCSLVSGNRSVRSFHIQGTKEGGNSFRQALGLATDALVKSIERDSHFFKAMNSALQLCMEDAGGN